MRRRDFVRLAAGAAVAWPATARAQFIAGRPITMIVPFPAGGGADILVRILTKYMSENLSQTIVVQNMPGAGGGLAFGQVARATADGHTLGWASTGFPVMAATLSNLSFKPESDFVHICNVCENPFVLVVNPQVPVNSVKELVDLAKARPEQPELRPQRCRDLDQSGGRTSQDAGRHRGGADRLSRRQFFRRRRDRGSCAGDVLEQPGGAAARRIRAFARSCGHDSETLVGRSRSSDHGGVRVSRFQGRRLAGLQRARPARPATWSIVSTHRRGRRCRLRRSSSAFRNSERSASARRPRSLRSSCRQNSRCGATSCAAPASNRTDDCLVADAKVRIIFRKDRLRTFKCKHIGSVWRS